MPSVATDIETHSASVRPLRVNFFVNFVHEQGTYFRFHNLAVGLNRLGHSVTVFAADINFRSHSRRETRDGIVYHIVPESPLNRVSGYCCEPIAIARRLAHRYPVCDVSHLFQPFPSAAAGWFGAPAKARFYDWDDLWSGGLMTGPVKLWREYWPRGMLRFLEQRLPGWADHVTAISKILADKALARGAKGVTLLNSGSWLADQVNESAVRTRLGLFPNALYAGFMGRTAAELPWCLEALAQNLDRHPNLRLAICGAPETYLDGLSHSIRDRIDYLGQLSPTDAKAFASCLDLGLIPLEENLFNNNRLPQKFGDHLAARVPLLCSNVGECGRLLARFNWAVPAGKSRLEWFHAFRDTIDRIAQGDVPAFDQIAFSDHMSWEGLSRKLAGAYYAMVDIKASGKLATLENSIKG